MKKDIKQIQNAQLGILEQLLAVFKEHNLNYIAVCGTLLGAYRHKGFIPWDDDIDLGMPREDYDRFLKMQNDMPDNLFIQHYSTESTYPLYFAKVRLNGSRFVERRFKTFDIHHGVYVDIFPLDNIDKSTNTESKFKQLEKCSDNFRRSLKPYKKWLYFLTNPFKNAKSYFAEYDKVSQSDNDKSVDKIGYLLLHDYFDVQENWSEHQLPFEHLMINVPHNIEKYLEYKYGNYMELPAEKDRKTHNIIEFSL
ncbi:LicD family protein [Thalassotalea crassostreae]|uniref:LicD family protein n=1 Tax=Thalassotalea crassostreae TaxID=1763536 RepID=UPI00083833E5|nr:LicD family protein [Thalassotalea crassostreae]